MDFYKDVIQPGVGFCLFCCVVGSAIKACLDSNKPTFSTSSSSTYDYSSSSSIEEETESSSGISSYPVQSVYPTGGGYNPDVTTGGGTYIGGSSSYGQTQQRERVWRDCSHCHGKGTVVHDSYVGTYGMDDPMIYCAECGRSWHQSTGHSHVTCPICHGNKGSWSE